MIPSYVYCSRLNMIPWVVMLLFGTTAEAYVLLRVGNIPYNFTVNELRFGPALPHGCSQGTVFLAEPIDACSTLKTNAHHEAAAFVLIRTRGGCGDGEKVRRAQEAGFSAAMLYEPSYAPLEFDFSLPVRRLKIHAVSITESLAELLQNKKYIGGTVWLCAERATRQEPVAAIFISVGVCLMLFFGGLHLVRQEKKIARADSGRDVMTSENVKAMPSLVFDSSTSCSSCAICLEDYMVGDELRILPCLDVFHACCVDSWLASYRSFCPVCKCDARAASAATESSHSLPQGLV